MCRRCVCRGEAGYFFGATKINNFSLVDEIVKQGFSSVGTRGRNTAPPSVMTTNWSRLGLNAVERMEGKYSVELFREGGEGGGIETTLARHDDLATARALYRWHTLNNRGVS
jgi:hypothetical protein